MLERPFRSRRTNRICQLIRKEFPSKAMRKIRWLPIICILWAGIYGASDLSCAFSSGKIPEPVAPTAPTAPLKPTLERKQLPDKSQPVPAGKPQEKTPRPGKPELRQTQPEIPPKKNEEKAPPTDNPPSALRQNAASSPPAPETPAREKANPTEGFIEPRPKSNESITGNATAPAWLNKLLYNLLFILPAAVAVYLFFNHEKKTSRPPDKQQEEPLPGISAHIKNASLLKQLIKFDMETCGMLRPGLDYKDPKLVEQMIIKYGRGDKLKIERAIQSFYKNRSKK